LISIEWKIFLFKLPEILRKVFQKQMKLFTICNSNLTKKFFLKIIFHAKAQRSQRKNFLNAIQLGALGGFA